MGENRIGRRLDLIIVLLLAIVGNLYFELLVLVLQWVGAVIPAVPAPFLGILAPAVVLVIAWVLARLSLLLESTRHDS
ncbi:hypothetical protein [Natrinema caseinilyticum]|uniref:hypothetical protein n=1 Tax=Natrinema caseinilyticum TaxID=2961570 RepID=UPI0020C3FAED|nr:hypothetical protein [Natrinema caseinilyticum]